MTACGLCRSTDVEMVFRKSDFTDVRDVWQVFLCKGCSVFFSHPQPTSAELNALYGREYLKSWGIEDDYEGVKDMKTKTFQRIIDKLEKYKENKGRLLDIGCAAGFLMEAAKERSWNPYGVDISQSSASIAKKTFGDRVFCGHLKDAEFPDKFFKVVVMVDLLEHVAEPKEFLKEVKRILSDDGVIFINTPNAGGWTAKIMGKRWPHYKKEHLYYFSKKSIDRFLDSMGLRIIEQSNAVKCLNLKYLYRQFKRYRTPFLTGFLAFLMRVFPEKLRRKGFFIPTGEINVIARVSGTPARLKP